MAPPQGKNLKNKHKTFLGKRVTLQSKKMSKAHLRHQ